MSNEMQLLREIEVEMTKLAHAYEILTGAIEKKAAEGEQEDQYTPRYLRNAAIGAGVVGIPAAAGTQALINHIPMNVYDDIATKINYPSNKTRLLTRGGAAGAVGGTLGLVGAGAAVGGTALNHARHAIFDKAPEQTKSAALKDVLAGVGKNVVDATAYGAKSLHEGAANLIAGGGAKMQAAGLNARAELEAGRLADGVEPSKIRMALANGVSSVGKSVENNAELIRNGAYGAGLVGTGYALRGNGQTKSASEENYPWYTNPYAAGAGFGAAVGGAPVAYGALHGASQYLAAGHGVNPGHPAVAELEGEALARLKALGKVAPVALLGGAALGAGAVGAYKGLKNSGQTKSASLKAVLQALETC